MRNRRLAKKRRLEREAEEIMARLRAPYVRPIKRFQAKWTFEEVADLKSTHGLDLEKEIADALAHEIDREIMEELRKYK